MTRARAVTLLCCAACGAVWMSGSLHPFAAPACIAWLALRELMRPRFDLRLPSNLVGVGGIALFVLFVVFNKPSHDPQVYLLGFLTAALLLLNLAEATRFNEYLIVLGSLIIVVVAAAAAAGLVPFFIAGLYLFVACHALLVLTGRTRARADGVRVRLMGDPGRWSLASVFAAHHIAGAGLILGALIYLVVPRLGATDGSDGLDADAEGLLASRRGRAGILGTEARTGFPTSMHLGDIGEIKRSTQIAFEATLRVFGKPYDPPENAAAMMLLRARAWDTYAPDEHRWTTRRQRSTALGRRGVLEVGDAPVDWTFSLREYAGKTLFLPQRTRRVRVFGTTLRIDPRGAVRVRNAVKSYGAEAALPPTSREEIAKLRPNHDDPYLLEVPPSLVPDLKRILKNGMSGFVSRPRSGALLANVDAIHRFFRAGGFRYTLSLPRELPSKDPLIAFLERREGHCELYATAACLFLRLAGIPARVAGGMRCAERISPGQYRARLSNAHAWVEVRCRGVGFVAFDFTPPDAAAVEPGATAAEIAAARAAGESGGAGSAEEDPVMEWGEPFRYGPREQQRLMRWVGGRLEGLVVPILAGAALLLVGWAVVTALRTRRRHTPRVRAPAGVPRRTLAFYVRFLRDCAQQGHRRSGTQTPREFLQSLPKALREDGEEITARFEQRRYGA